MRDREPRGRRGRRRCEVDPHSSRMQEVEHFVEPGEVELALAGSMRAQEKMPTDARLTPALFISVTSSRQTSVGHCSGL